MQIAFGLTALSSTGNPDFNGTNLYRATIRSQQAYYFSYGCRRRARQFLVFFPQLNAAKKYP